MSALAVVPTMPETVAGLSRRLAELLEESEAHGTQSQLQDGTRAQAADLVEAPRVRIVRKVDRDHRSLFELDDRLIELMVLVEEAPDAGAAISEELAQEIDVYLEAYRHKVDRIVGYWRWHQSIADISGKETERLAARKRAAENRVNSLKGFLFAFIIGTQRNSTASLVIDDPLQIAEHFFERHVRFTKTELQEIVHQLVDGEVRRRLELALKDKWEVNGEAVRVALMSREPILGARLVTGSHLQMRWAGASRTPQGGFPCKRTLTIGAFRQQSVPSQCVSLNRTNQPTRSGARNIWDSIGAAASRAARRESPGSQVVGNEGVLSVTLTLVRSAPSLITTIRSARMVASGMLCVVRIVVRPALALKFHRTP